MGTNKRRGSSKGSASRKKRSSIGSADDETPTRVTKGLEALAGEYAESGDLDRAARCLAAAVAMAGDTVGGGRASLRLGEMLQAHTTRSDDAAAALEMALTVLPHDDPERYRAAARLAEVREAAGDLEGAAEALEAGLGPDDGQRSGGSAKAKKAQSSALSADAAPWFCVCLIRLCAVLRVIGKEDAAARQLTRCADVADAAGDAHTRAIVRLLTAQQSIDLGDFVAAEGELDALGLGADAPPGYMTLAGVSYVLRLELLGRQGASVDALKETVKELHALMKRFDPAAEEAAGAPLQWMSRKQLIVLAYHASVVATSTIGSLREAREYAVRALDLIERQRSAVPESVRGKFELLACDDFHLPLLEQCVALRIGVHDFVAAQKFLLEGISLIDRRSARYGDRRPAWRALVASYLDATGETEAAERHLGLAADAVEGDVAAIVIMAKALHALRSETDAADKLAELAGVAAKGEDSRDAAAARQFVSGLQRLCAGDFDGATELLRVKEFKMVSKRLHNFAVMAMALCYRGEGDADGAALFAKVDKAAKTMDDHPLKRCVALVTDSSSADKEQLESEYRDAVASAVAQPGHATLCNVWASDDTADAH